MSTTPSATTATRLPPAADESSWRVEVGTFRRDHPQRTFPMQLSVGEPGGDRVALEVPWPVPPGYDVGLRFDLMTALFGRWRDAFAGVDPCAWLSRPGTTGLHDADLAWHASTRHAGAAEGVSLLGFRVVTKGGWLDVGSGEHRSWKRLRLRQTAETSPPT